MTLIEVIPHVRFADRLILRESRALSRADDTRLLYILNGSARMTLKGREYDLQRGVLALLPPDSSFSLSPDSEIELAVLGFDLTQRRAGEPAPPSPFSRDDAAPAWISREPVLSDAPLLAKPLIRDSLFYLEDAISEILREVQQRRPFFAEKVSTLLKALLIELVRGEQEQENNRDMLDRIIAFIDEHIGEDVTNQTVSAALFYSPRHLGRLMKQQTGMTLHQFVLQRRFLWSTRLLLDPRLSISEIASKLGFCSDAHFSGFFKKEAGITPTRFRRDHAPSDKE
ncbi:MAG: helix-turn-helix domain-containing protein [Clostridia bacterium]|nr:helix-turn-helix domain-containing protein [Clostridia bacterium]